MHLDPENGKNWIYWEGVPPEILSRDIPKCDAPKFPDSLLSPLAPEAAPFWGSQEANRFWNSDTETMLSATSKLGEWKNRCFAFGFVLFHFFGF